jgi:hypothetical protein
VAYRTYTRRLEVVKAKALARIKAEEGIQAIVSVVRKAEKVFLAVKVARAGSKRSRRSKKRLVRLAYT